MHLSSVGPYTLLTGAMKGPPHCIPIYVCMGIWDGFLLHCLPDELRETLICPRRCILEEQQRQLELQASTALVLSSLHLQATETAMGAVYCQGQQSHQKHT